MNGLRNGATISTIVLAMNRGINKIFFTTYKSKSHAENLIAYNVNVTYKTVHNCRYPWE